MEPELSIGDTFIFKGGLILNNCEGDLKDSKMEATDETISGMVIGHRTFFIKFLEDGKTVPDERGLFYEHCEKL